MLVELRDDARATLEALRSRGVLLSVASRSKPEVASAILRALGLLDYFVSPCFEWQDKDVSLRKILSDLEREHSIRVGASEVLFIDDWPSNVRDASRVGVQGLVFGREIASLAEVVAFLDARRL